jgi:transcriptional regulator with XRE-family HTH domain
MIPQIFIVEKTATGFSAYAEDFDNFSVGTTGKNLSELKANILEAINLHQEYHNASLYTPDLITLKYDLPQFFQFYKEINAKALAKRVGMNQTLLSQYVNGKKSPSDKQVKKILTGIKELGRELTELELV